MRVVFLTAVLTHYRLPLHESVRSLLQYQGVQYEVIYGQPIDGEVAKNDTASLRWGRLVKNTKIGFGGRSVLFQPVLTRVLGADLVIIGQENRLLINYILQSLPKGLRPRVALWGHGRNYQSRSPQGFSERWKRLWATRCDWWFAYTEQTRRHIESLGFPPERITVFNNAVDTAEIRRLAELVTDFRLAELRRELNLLGRKVAIFVGGLYGDKRLEFLVAASDQIRTRITDFELIIIGDGPDAHSLQQQALIRPWLKLVGPRFGLEKVELMRLGQVFLMPGLVGLGVLDANAVGLPLITTNYPYHSPEIEYLENGSSGLIVGPWQDVDVYADAVASLLNDEVKLAQFSRKARCCAEKRTISEMSSRLSDGILGALSSSYRL